ncbi:hypothetical protein LINPERPRIM_LOCUS38920 [Linum perenne]
MKQMQALRDYSVEEFQFQISNVQARMSAALTDEETCTDELKKNLFPIG